MYLEDSVEYNGKSNIHCFLAKRSALLTDTSCLLYLNFHHNQINAVDLAVFGCLFFSPSAYHISLKWLKGQLFCAIMASQLCYKSCSLFPPWVLRLTVAMVSKVEKGEAETCVSLPFKKKETFAWITICR